MSGKRFFASDNTSRVHQKIMDAITAVNVGNVPSYGDDEYTSRAERRFRDVFGEDTDVFFVYNGTGANVLGISAVTRSYHAILTTETAHINEDECGAPEKLTGCSLITVPSEDGKLDPAGIKEFAGALGNQHRSQPKVVSITQSTELGTVYSPEEIRALADFAHKHGMLLHMDGARIANAAAHLRMGLRECTRDLGVDILSFGGTKNGMMFGEAVLFFRSGLAEDFRFFRKQGMQLASKMRYIAAQFEALLTDDLWLENAQAANTAARFLAEQLAEIPEVEITQEVQSNAVFATLPREILPEVLESNYFYTWNEHKSEVRLMASFDTTGEEILALIDDITRCIGKKTAEQAGR